jgi:Na+(H+)/acetate symporter ActP
MLLATELGLIALCKADENYELLAAHCGVARLRYYTTPNPIHSRSCRVWTVPFVGSLYASTPVCAAGQHCACVAT